MKRNLSKRFAAVIISSLMVFTLIPTNSLSTDPENVVAAELNDGSYAPNEVMVTFRKNAIEETDTSLSSAQSMANIDSDFGDFMDATGEADDAADDASSEVEIISKSLGNNYTIKDSIEFDDELNIALIYSDVYDTETMMSLLSTNKYVASVEPNYYAEPQSEGSSYDYSLNDKLNTYDYQANNPQATNSSGKNVHTRGTDMDKTVSTNAGSAWARYNGSEDDEVVVAVIDSGININHEDLKDSLWVNDPEKTGLKGINGFNFDDNDVMLTDREGHGTHCSGIIGATANNGKGIAGVASGVNVKIMMLAKSGTYRKNDMTKFIELGAFNYAIKARQRGVNVVAISCSWCNPGNSYAYDEVLTRLGEAGILVFCAAGNENINIDKYPEYPVGGDNPYQIVVGAMDINGKKAGFSNYGKSTVDVFAPGLNILSTSSRSVYAPFYDTVEEREEYTEYYAQFSDKAVITDDGVIPDNGGGNVSSFGKSVFFKQLNPNADTTENYDPDAATVEYEITSEKHYMSSPGKSLKLTIKNAQFGEDYYLVFPYNKNPDTTGEDNTRYSMLATCSFEENGEEHDFEANINMGEMIKNDEGTYEEIPSTMYFESKPVEDGSVFHSSPDKVHYPSHYILSYDELEGRDVGFGFHISPTLPQEGNLDDYGDVHDIHLYIESLAVSKPFDNIKKVFSPNTSYEIMSGTSMATPAAAASYAVLAALNPQKVGQTGSQYALENKARYFAAVTKTDELKNYCSTGGYIDCSKFDTTGSFAEISPAITDAVCDVEKETLTLSGAGLTSALNLSYISLADKNAEEVTLPNKDMSVKYSDDGRTAIISNAKPLFGTYKEFLLRKKGDDEVLARGSFFLVKGQKKLDQLLVEKLRLVDSWGDPKVPSRTLLTDNDGKELYSYEKDTGIVSRFDGRQFVDYQDTYLKEQTLEFFRQGGFNSFELTNDFDVSIVETENPIYGNEVVYSFVDVTHYANHPREKGDDNDDYDEADADEDGDVEPDDSEDPDEEEAQDEEYHYLAFCKYTDDNPTWQFTEIDSFDDIFEDVGVIPKIFAPLNGKLYAFGNYDEETTFVYSYDFVSGQWNHVEDTAAMTLISPDVYVNDGKIYFVFGMTSDRMLSREVHCFDGTNWNKLQDIPFIGKYRTPYSEKSAYIEAACAFVKNGFILFDASVEGTGNISLFDMKNEIIQPTYYTLNDSLSDSSENASAVETRDGIYLIKYWDTGESRSNALYLLPKSSGVYESQYEDEKKDDPTPTPKPSPAPTPDGSKDNPVVKKANPAKITVKKLTVKSSVIKKKKQTKKAITVKKAQGKVTYKLSGVTKKKFKKYFKVNSKTGKITIRKGLKKGNYKVKVKVTVAGNNNYKKLTKTVTVKVKVK
ncbi:MAG: S8 family serine peptidase [Eubacterium sp.]|nr:S8 family serine peptidase [Eubacterium sp.]